MTLDGTLARQLRRLGLAREAVPSLEAWQHLLHAVSEHYRHGQEDRDLLARSIELSTDEMNGMRRQVEKQRDDLTEVVRAVAEVLTDFGKLVDDDTGRTGAHQAARDAFTQRLDRVFQRSSTSSLDWSGSVSSIRTNLVQLADQLLRLLAETADRAAIKKEFEVARAVQQLLIPATNVVERSYATVASHFQPASACGGDWWDVAELPDGRTIVIVGDVTGHGISSAIITGAAKAAFELTCQILGAQLTAEQLLDMMNLALNRTARRQVLMTCSLGIYEPATRKLTLGNAGHCFPLLIRRGLSHPMVLSGAPLGSGADATFATTTLTTDPGDTLIWYTDGLAEAENPHHEQFGERRLRAICQRAAADGAATARHAIVEAVAAFTQGVAPGDDMTLVVMTFR